MSLLNEVEVGHGDTFSPVLQGTQKNLKPLLVHGINFYDKSSQRTHRAIRCSKVLQYVFSFETKSRSYMKFDGGPRKLCRFVFFPRDRPVLRNSSETIRDYRP